MRLTAIIVALFIALALGSAASVFAQTAQQFREPNAAAKGRTMAPPAKSKPKGTARPDRGEVGTTAVPLTDKECTTLGGKVFQLPQASQGVCNSGKYCERMDQNKVKHAVCISAR